MMSVLETAFAEYATFPPKITSYKHLCLAAVSAEEIECSTICLFLCMCLLLHISLCVTV